MLISTTLFEALDTFATGLWIGWGMLDEVLAAVAELKDVMLEGMHTLTLN
jgi:hypothetical protein